jgi:class 3 adenylate cyclase
MTDHLQTPQADPAIEPEQPSLASRIKQRLAGNLSVNIGLLAIVLAGLPLAVWLDLRTLSENSLRSQVDGLATVIGSFRNYYSSNVVERVMSNHGQTIPAANFLEIPGAIPIPATLSLDLGSVLGGANQMSYRFFSDYPFAHRAPHAFDDFERKALTDLREKRQSSVYDVSGSVLERRVRLVTPIIMGATCVTCHNTSPDSPKRDWKIGDVRGIEEFSVSQPLAGNIFAFKYLMLYFALVAAVGFAWIALQRYQSRIIARVNSELGRTNEFLVGIAQKLAKYLSPQHYRSIFSGETDAVVSTERKKLTIFFSDVVNFTATTERLQPEELTALLNDYLTEMSQIAIKHGGSVNKFIGDAMLVIFGDQEARGVTEDARACMLMAFEMQRRLAELNVKWRQQGIEAPFRARMGINTGYCNVGNFGSEQRMDYTIIGGEANLAARLQSIAEPGGIVVSYETFILVSDMVHAQALAPITLKGIGRPIVPYTVEATESATIAAARSVIAEHTPGLDLLLDVRRVDPASSAHVTRVLEAALAAIKNTSATEPSQPKQYPTAD